MAIKSDLIATFMIAKNVWDPIIVILIIFFNGFITSFGVMLQMCRRRLSQGKAPTENINTNVKFDRAKIVQYMPLRPRLFLNCPG